MFEHYVYVPYADRQMDDFAKALVEEKNKHNRFFGHHTLIKRADQGNAAAAPLAVVGTQDRLYVCIHGSAGLAGVGVYFVTVPTGRELVRTDRHQTTGEQLAAHLVALGLANKSISLRLWTCWGGGKANENRDGDTAGDGDRRSFALRVAAGLKAAGHTAIEVVGYTHLVYLNVDDLRNRHGKKNLQTVAGTANFTDVSDQNRVRIQVKAI